MKDPDEHSESPSLFDLPLDQDAGTEGPPRRDEAPAGQPRSHGRRERGGGRSLPLFPEPDTDRPASGEDAPPAAPAPATPPTEWPQPPPLPPEEEPPVPPRRRPAARRPAPFSLRLAAGGLDLAVHLVLLALLVVGGRLLGARVGLGAWPGLAAFLLVFSFLYMVVPLAFWGRTPGMARVGLIARGPADEPLTFGQTGLRWLGALLTVAALGLPGLLALVGGRSLTDRLSGSATYLRHTA